MVDYAWVEGVKKCLMNNPYNQKFILITATPQKKIDMILSKMNCLNVFNKAYGYPINKYKSIRDYINYKNILFEDVLFIWDSCSDLFVAKKANIDFCLRITKYNKGVQMKHQGIRFKSLEL